jgi:hypothetical protein
MSKGSRNRTKNWKAYREGWERCFGRRLVVRREDEEEVRKAIESAPDGSLVPIVVSDAVPDDMALVVKDGKIEGVLKTT